jgi:hypothetical protein
MDGRPNRTSAVKSPRSSPASLSEGREKNLVSLSEKQNSCYGLSMPFHRSRLSEARAGASSPVMELKNLEDRNLHLDLLQPIEIPPNHLDIPWKSLALEPHFFGKAWQKSLEVERPDLGAGGARAL